MLNTIRRPVLFWMSLAFIAAAAKAQVVPAAYGPGHSLWVGGEYSNVSASFPYQNAQRLWGISAFADYNFSGRLGVEAGARWLRFNSFYGETEDNYLAGPRYTLGKFGRFQPYAKFLVGIGKIQYPFTIRSGTYLALAPGGGIDYRLSPRWAVRGEYEYQLWPGSPGFANEPAHELTPNGFHVGIAFQPFR
ncbi:MAG: porin family protein [Terracidiphilus sp.]|jgi:opacity protein-like surface antigen